MLFQHIQERYCAGHELMKEMLCDERKAEAKYSEADLIDQPSIGSRRWHGRCIDLEDSIVRSV